MELLTGLGLATASGLNAYIPLLALGLLSWFTDLVSLPHGWARRVAVLLPVVVLAVLAQLVCGFVKLWRRRRRQKAVAQAG